MKLLIVLSLLAYGYADKLDRTYLPPPGAATAGGSPGSLAAPGQGFGQPAPPFRGSQSPAGRPFDSAGPSQPGPSGFGQDRPNQAFGGNGGSASGFARPSGPSQAGPSGFGQDRPNLSGNSAFGRPSGQAGFPSGTGVQPPSNQFGQAGQAQSFAQQPERPQASADRNAEILRYDNQNDGETFSYNFETSNGISAEESGVATNGVQAQGGFSYTGDDGQFYKITYTADENGYLPQGDHLPTPPPIPDEILKSIEENAKAAAAGTQEGAYNPEEDNSPQYNAPSFNQGQGQVRGSANGFGPSGSAGQPSGPQGSGFNQGSTQGGQGFGQGSQPAFNGNQGQRAQGQAGQGQGQSGYEYSRPQNQGRQPSGPNAIPSGPSKAPGQTQSPFPGQNQPSSGPVSNQKQYVAPEANQRQSGSRPGSGPQSYNQGSQGPRQPGQGPRQPGQGPSQLNQNQFGAGAQPSRPNFSQNRPTNQQQQTQGFPAQRGSQAQGPRGNTQNQDGYDYNRPQSTFNSGNQAQTRPQGPGGSRPQAAFPGSSGQGQPGFPGSQSQTGFPGSQSQTGYSGSQSQTGFPGSQRQTGYSGSQSQTGYPGSQSQTGFPGSQSQTGFPGSQSQTGFPGASRPAVQGPQGSTPQFPGPRGQQPQRPSQQETFGGPRQPPSFSPEEGYKY